VSYAVSDATLSYQKIQLRSWIWEEMGMEEGDWSNVENANTWIRLPENPTSKLDLGRNGNVRVCVTVCLKKVQTVSSKKIHL